MLRLVLLVLYFFAPSTPSLHSKQGLAGPNEPFFAVTANAGAGYDPDGAAAPSSPPPADAGAGYDPNG